MPYHSCTNVYPGKRSHPRELDTSLVYSATDSNLNPSAADFSQLGGRSCLFPTQSGLSSPNLLASAAAFTHPSELPLHCLYLCLPFRNPLHDRRVLTSFQASSTVEHFHPLATIRNTGVLNGHCHLIAAILGEPASQLSTISTTLVTVEGLTLVWSHEYISDFILRLLYSTPAPPCASSHPQ